MKGRMFATVLSSTATCASLACLLTGVGALHYRILLGALTALLCVSTL